MIDALFHVAKSVISLIELDQKVDGRILHADGRFESFLSPRDELFRDNPLFLIHARRLELDSPHPIEQNWVDLVCIVVRKDKDALAKVNVQAVEVSVTQVTVCGRIH